ncbi:sulfatase, partial [Chlamydiota bacterium]
SLNGHNMTKKFQNIFLIGFVTSFFLGFLFALYYIFSNSYFSYRLYRLIILTFQKNIHFFVGIFLLCFSFLFVFFNLFLKAQLGNRKRVWSLLFLMTFVSLVFVIGKYIFEKYSGVLIPAILVQSINALFRDHVITLLLFTVFLLCLFLLVEILFYKIPLFHRKMIAYLRKKNNGLYVLKKLALFCAIFLTIFDLFAYLSLRASYKKKPNIILLVIDALRPDHLGCYGHNRNTSPFIDQLAKEGIIFTNAYANASWTKPSVGTILSGQYPNIHNAINVNDLLSNKVLSLSEMVQNAGYQTLYYDGNNVAIDASYNFNQGFDYYTFFDQVDAAFLTNTFISKLSKLKEKPFFAYLHFMDCHVPYHQNEFNSRFTGGVENKKIVPGEIVSFKIRGMTFTDVLSPADKEYHKALYDGQITYVDNLIKDIFLALKKENIVDNTIVIITADHGEEFWEHGNFGHGNGLYNEILKVPLIIYGSTVTHTKIDARVRLIDIVPTILDFTDIEKPIPVQFDGISLLNVIDDPKGINSSNDVFSMGTLYGDEKYCLIKNDTKLIFNTFNKNEKQVLIGKMSDIPYELYDLANDPSEKNNIKKRDETLFKNMEKELSTFTQIQSPYREETIEMDEDREQAFRSLGYAQ